ncbi:MAG: FtsX-like permease family protein [Acidobacteria bacterium]|nr:FtsX-like permease family protein [Acidobacteriota bacterium]
MSPAARWYERVLRLGPRGLRREFGDDMVATFDAMLEDERRRGRRMPHLRVWGRVLPDLLVSTWNSMRGQSSVYRIPTRKIPMEARLHDIRFALRMMSRQPLYTLVAVLTVAVGISATTSIFSIANGLLLRAPDGVRGGSDLVSIHRVAQDGSGFHSFGVTMFRHLAASETGLESVAAYDTFSGSMVIDSIPYRVAATNISGNYFETVGARPAMGRFFHASEDTAAGRDLVAVISHSLWQERFDATPDIVGTSIGLNGHDFTIVGVAEPGFSGHLAALTNQLWVPLSVQRVLAGEEDLSEEASVIGVEVVARLAPGSSADLARDALDRAGAAFHETRTTDWWGADVLGYAPIIPIAREGLGIFLAVMFGVAGVLLTITAVNVANMMLARGAARSREVGVRLALGASRRRLISQLLAESILLFVAGGALGTLLTIWIMGALGGITLPVPIPIDLHFAPDLTVLAFALGIAAISGVVFGLSPALHATNGDLVTALKDSGASSHRRRRLRSVLVVTQVAGSALLLVVAGLLIRSAGRASSVDVGLDINGVYAYIIDTRDSNQTDAESVIFYDDLLAQASRLPGVGAITAIDVPPLTGSNQQSSVILPDLPPEPGIGLRQVEYATVAPNYLQAMRIPLVAGRDLSTADTRDTPVVVLVNEHLARTFWPGESAVGQRIQFRGTPPIDIEIVGVMADTKIRTPGDEPRPLMYGHWAQFPGAQFTVLARTGGGEVAAAVRDIVTELDPVMPPATPILYSEFVGLALLPMRIAMILATVFGAAGLLLASIGLYGLLAFSVVQRSAEIGIRVALGAHRTAVQGLVVREGLRLTLVGLVIGLAAAAGLGQLLGSLLFGLSPFDPLTFGSITVLMLTIAGFACWLPARRAAATDPVNVLRAE